MSLQLHVFLQLHVSSSDHRFALVRRCGRVFVASFNNRGFLRVGAGKMLELLRHADPNMRRGAAETLLQFSKLLEGAPLALRKQLTSRTTLSLLILGLKVRTLTIVATDTAV